MKQKAFTLLEILLVIAAIGILAAIVIVAINPQRQLQQVRNAALQNSVNTLASAIEQYVIDGESIPVPYPAASNDGYQVICDTGSDSSENSLDPTRECIDLRILVPTYLASIPVDESATEESGIAIALNPDNERISTIIVNNPNITFNTNDTLIASLTPNIWTPDQISTELWLDASLQSSVISYQPPADTFVAEWLDKSGNNRHASQSVATAQPTYSENTLEFNGTTDYLDVDLDFLAGESHRAYFVFERTSGYSNLYGAADANQGANSLHVGFLNNSQYRVNYWGNDYGPSFAAGFNPNSTNILSFQWIPGTGKSVYSNGYLQGQNTSAGTIGTMSGGGRLFNTTGHPMMGGMLSEVIFVLNNEINVQNNDLIEGYLAHKWDLESSLPMEHPYRNIAPDWSPSDISTDLWLDASDPTTVIFQAQVEKSFVSTWQDLSLNNRDAIQLDFSAMPEYVDDRVFFDTDTFLNLDLDFLAGQTHRSYFVFKRTSGYSNLYGATNGGEGANSLHVGFRDIPSFRVNHWGNNYEPAFNTGYNDSDINIVSYEWISGTRKSVYSNGYLQGQSSSAGVIGTMSGGGRLMSVVQGAPMSGDMYEVIFLINDQITPDNDTKIVGYLAHKWELQDSLPNNHPYKNEAPQLDEE